MCRYFLRRWAIGAVFIMALWFVPSPAQAQSCANPPGVPGDIVYNSAHDVFQGCTTRGWHAFHQSAPVPPDPCISTTTPGTACADGLTVYAGSYNGHRYITTKTDLTTSRNLYYGTYYIDLGEFAADSEDGLVNTNTALARIEANPSATCDGEYNPPGCAPNAFVACKALRTTLGGDWYLPAVSEITGLFYPNRAAIGGFYNTTLDRYISSTQFDDNSVMVVYLTTGVPNRMSKNGTQRARCVRRV